MTTFLAFFLLICVLVAVHEYGHFWAARRCGVKVLRFSIGFGKVLYKRVDKQGTEWVFSLIPLGGYVKMLNEEEGIIAAPSERYQNKSVWARMLIILAGPMANFLFGILAYWVVFMAGVSTVKPVVGTVIPQTIAARAELSGEFEIKSVAGRPVRDWEETLMALIGQIGTAHVEIEGSFIGEDYRQTKVLDLSQWQVEAASENPLTTLGIRPKSATVEPTIKNVVENSAAQQAGILAGDKILTVNQTPFEWSFLIQQVSLGKPVELAIERNGKTLVFTVQPLKSEKEKRYLIGIEPSYTPLSDKYRTEIKYDILTALTKSVEKVGSLIYTIVQFIGNLITGDLSLNNMGGPIAMAKGAAASAEIGWVYYLGFMALISVNLGVMNLFPIVPLDGGQFVLLSVEALRGKPLSEAVQLRFQQLGMFMVLALMVFALFNDFAHF